MKKFKVYFVTLLQILFFNVLSSAQTVYTTQTSTINPNFPKNPRAKSGFNLIFEDEFNGNAINFRNWDLSSSNPVDDQPCGAYDYDFMPGQVSVSGGNCILKAEKATTTNSNCPITKANGCDVGVCGEIKTETYHDASKHSDFTNYQFPVGSYIETRAQMTDTKCGVGSSFWLLGGEQEIDVVELKGNTGNEFSSGYFTGRWIDGVYYKPYEKPYWWDGYKGRVPSILGVGTTVKGEDTYIYEDRLVWHKWKEEWVNIKDVKAVIPGKDVDLSTTFVTYGTQYTNKDLKFFINNQNYYTLDFEKYSKDHDQEILSMTNKQVRLSTGSVTGGGGTPCKFGCPSDMKVDYLRVYLPIGQKLLSAKNPVVYICENVEKELHLNYSNIPGITYSWGSSAFDFLYGTRTRGYATIKAKSATVKNQKYVITVTATFPAGYQEIVSFDVFYETNYIFQTPEIQGGVVSSIDGLVYFGIKEEAIPSCKCKGSIYEWNINGVDWVKTPDGTSIRVSPKKSTEVCVRAVDCNGIAALPKCVFSPAGGYKVISDSNTQMILDEKTNSPKMEGTDLMDKNYDINVSDVMGRVVIQTNITNPDELDMSKLDSGLYFISVFSHGKQIRTSKFYKK